MRHFELTFIFMYLFCIVGKFVKSNQNENTLNGVNFYCWTVPCPSVMRAQQVLK